MEFQDNVIKAYLRNVYFITGTPCGGKTVISRELGRRFDIPVYDVDERFPEHQLMSDIRYQPCMNRTFRDADEFFSRSVEEYRRWLLGNTREQMDFILLDLIRLSAERKVICDCHLTIEEALRISDRSRVAYLIREPVELVDDYCNRPDHQDFSDFIHSASDFEAAKKTCNETLLSLNMQCYNDIKKSGFFWLERDLWRTVDDTAALLAQHFGW